MSTVILGALLIVGVAGLAAAFAEAVRADLHKPAVARSVPERGRVTALHHGRHRR